MIQHQVKLRLSATKEAQLNDWLWMLNINSAVNTLLLGLEWASNLESRHVA